jgi:hypothetical protein
MKTSRVVIVLLACGVLLFGLVQPAHATLGGWTIKYSWMNFSGTSDALSGRMVRKLVTTPAQWVADIVSYTDYPPITITLGWTYSSATERCGTVIKQNVQGGAKSVSGNQIANSIFVNTMSCSLTRYGSSNGKNEFKYGGTTKWDEWSQQEIIP